LLVLKDGTEIYGKNEQFRKVDKCPRVEQNRKDYELCDTACVQVTHAERDAIWKAISLGFDTRGATMFLTGHWICCDDCRRSMKVAGIKECYLINDNDKIINYVSFENDEALGIMDKDYTEAMNDYLNL
jgi:deoxycytidylate deaminase